MAATSRTIGDFAAQGANRFLTPEQQEIAGIRSQSRNIALGAIANTPLASGIAGLTGNTGTDIGILEQTLAGLAGLPNIGAVAQMRNAVTALLGQFRALESATQANIVALQKQAALRVADSLKTFGSSLTLSQFSPLSPTEQLREARSQYQALLQRALGGDQGAAEQFQSSAQQLLGLSRGVNASGGRFVADFNTVRSDTAALEALFRDRASLQQQQTDSARDTAENTATGNEIAGTGFTGTIDGLETINETLQEILRIQREALA
jgi:hypothetical protein